MLPSLTRDRIYGVQDFVMPQTIYTAKNGIPDQTDRIYTLFQNKTAKSIPYLRLEMLENDTLWGGTYLYGLWLVCGSNLDGCL